MSVMTVCGEIEADELGITLSHEHLFVDATNQFTESSNPQEKAVSRQKVSRSHLELLRRNPYAMRDNLLLDDIDLAEREVDRFKKLGGKTIVDCTSIGIKRQIRMLKELSERTGLHVVAGSGYYTQDTHPPEIAEWSVGRIAECILEDFAEGIDDTGIKAGVIGEIGTSDPIHPDEAKCLRAAAAVCTQTGAVMQVHTYPWGKTGIEIAEILVSEKVDPGRIVICHTDVVLDVEYMTGLLERGVYVQFDDFGKEFTLDAADDLSRGAFAAGGFASDRERIAVLKELLEAGYIRQILLTTDVCLKCLLHIYGGYGYGHILENIFPMMQAQGISQRELDVLIRENPKTLLDSDVSF